MFSVLRFPPRQVWIAPLAMLVLWGGSATAQNFTMEVADSNPLGVESFIPDIQDFDLGFESSIKGDFSYGVDFETEYNSNFFLTDGNEKSELSAFIAPWIRYSSDPEGGAIAAVAVSYRPTFHFYNDNSHLNKADQGGDITLSLRGSRTDVTFFARYNEVTGTDQLTGDFITGRIFTGGVRGTRLIAPRTSLFGDLSVAKSAYDSSQDDGAEIYTGRLGALWQSTPRTSFGSSLRYTRTESDNTGTREALALLAELRYKLGERIWLTASLGPEYSSNSGSGSSDSFNLTGEIVGKYIIDARWSMSASLRSATVPSPNQNNYLVNDLQLTTSIQRQLQRGFLRGGIDYRFSDYEDVGTDTMDTVSDVNNVGVFLGYHRDFFKGRLRMDSMIRYNVNDGQTDWSQFIATLGFDVIF